MLTKFNIIIAALSCGSHLYLHNWSTAVWAGVAALAWGCVLIQEKITEQSVEIERLRGLK